MAESQVRWRAPGRVNLIGEHTDYNDGFVLPFAIDPGCTADVRRGPDGVLRIRSAQQAEPVTVDLDALRPGELDWAGYPAGVVWAIGELGHRVPGLEITVDSDVPSGAGLSSSAALVCSVAGAVDDLLGLELSPDDLLALTRRAENDFVGAPTGGMDQLASLRSRADHALFCDMRSLDTDQVSLPLADAGLRVLVIDTRAPHRHADGEYGRRREGCERAADLLGVPALRDITSDGLDDALDLLPDDELRRYTRHVVTENARVLDTVALLRDGRVRDIGPLLVASHASLRDDYRVTIPELDVAVAALLDAGAVGARMTGGGFGGCVIGLVDDGLVDTALAAVRQAFADKGFSAPEHLVVAPTQGAHRVSG